MNPHLGSGGIHDAAAGGDLERVKALLKDHPDLVFNQNTKGLTPLHWAALKGHKEVAEWLLASKAEVYAKDNRGCTALRLAAWYGQKDLVELLFAHGPEVSVHDAAAGGVWGKLEALLKGNPDLVFSRDTTGATPLHAAATGGHKAVVELLLTDVVELLRQHGGHE